MRDREHWEKKIKKEAQTCRILDLKRFLKEALTLETNKICIIKPLYSGTI